MCRICDKYRKISVMLEIVRGRNDYLDSLVGKGLSHAGFFDSITKAHLKPLEYTPTPDSSINYVILHAKNEGHYRIYTRLRYGGYDYSKKIIFFNKEHGLVYTTSGNDYLTTVHVFKGRLDV